MLLEASSVVPCLTDLSLPAHGKKADEREPREQQQYNRRLQHDLEWP
jgi:hypothetical protein